MFFIENNVKRFVWASFSVIIREKGQATTTTSAEISSVATTAFPERPS